MEANMCDNIDVFVDALFNASVPPELEELSHFLYTLKPRAVIAVGSACTHVSRNSLSDIDLILLWKQSELRNSREQMMRYEINSKLFSMDYLGPHIQFGYLFVIRSLEKRFSLDLGLTSCHFFSHFMPGPYVFVWGTVESAPLSPPICRTTVFEQTLWQALKACASGKALYAIDYLSRARSLALLILSSNSDFGGMSRQHYSRNEESRLLACSCVSNPSISDILVSIKSLCSYISAHIPGIDIKLDRWITLFGLNAHENKEGKFT